MPSFSSSFIPKISRFVSNILPNQLFALNLPISTKIQLFLTNKLKIPAAQLLWLMRSDGAMVKLNQKKEVVWYRLWKEEKDDKYYKREPAFYKDFKPLPLYGATGAPKKHKNSKKSEESTTKASRKDRKSLKPVKKPKTTTQKSIFFPRDRDYPPEFYTEPYVVLSSCSESEDDGCPAHLIGEYRNFHKILLEEPSFYRPLPKPEIRKKFEPMQKLKHAGKLDTSFSNDENRAAAGCDIEEVQN